MAEQILEKAAEVPVQPVETPVQPVQEQPKVVEPVKEDLISRVSKVKVAETKPVETNAFNLTKEDYDKVQSDPVLSKFYKSMQADYVRKTQNLSEQQREIEKIKNEKTTWTTEKVQQLLNDKTFVQAAQQVAQNPPNSGLTNEEYSALTDKEKAQLNSMQQQVQQLTQQNFQMQQRQQDEQLRVRYANYAPDIVDTTINKLVSKQVNATREDIWKVIDYENAVQRAYELGKTDRLLDNQMKTESMSIDGYNATPSQDVPKQNDKESNTAYFKRLAVRRLSEIKGRG